MNFTEFHVAKESDKPSIFTGNHSGEIEALEKVARLPVYSIDELLDALPELDVTYVGNGTFGHVFRLQSLPVHPDMTLKLMRAENPRSYAQFDALATATGLSHSEADFKSYFKEPDQELIGSQMVGHMKGNSIAPVFIDAPICAWSQKNYQGEVQVVGYSLPFIAGSAIKYVEDERLLRLSNWLVRKHSVYPGSSGHKTDAHNAIVNTSIRVKKFIDVRMLYHQPKE